MDATPSRAEGLAGRAFLEAIMDGRLPRPTMADTLDFTLESVEDGRAVFVGRPSRALYNPLGSVHGGYAATLLDSAMGCAVHSQLDAGLAFTTLELKVSFVRALGAETGAVRGRAGRSLEESYGFGQQAIGRPRPGRRLGSRLADDRLPRRSPTQRAGISSGCSGA